MTGLDRESEFLTCYARLRMERLVKVARAAVREVLDGHAPDRHPILVPLRLYADLLAQAIVEARYSTLAERRMIHHLRRNAEINSEILARIERLAESMDSDREACDAAALREELPPKKGMVGLSTQQLGAWLAWMKNLPRDASSMVVAILSRGLADGAVAARIMNLPLRFVCYSRHRLDMREVCMLDTQGPAAPAGHRVLLVDAHMRTGETIARCVESLTEAGLEVSSALITHFEGSPAGIPPFTQPVEIASGGWVALHRPPSIATASQTVTDAPGDQPIIALSGEPGSGKTLVRKALVLRTGWRAIPWSRCVRELMREIGGRSMETFRALTKEEALDPELVAREFLMEIDSSSLDASKPILVEGIKSAKALGMVGRYFGRPINIVRVSRSSAARAVALRERSDFDDGHDVERAALLQSVGLPALLSLADSSIDASDSTVERETGLVHIGHETAAGVERLAERFGAVRRPVSVRRVNAKLLLMHPREHLILMLRSAKTSKWGLPGGGIEGDETPWEAAVRELREETGQSEPEGPLGGTVVVRSGIEVEGHILEDRIMHVFFARSSSQDVTLSHEHIEARWATVGEMAAILPHSMRELPSQALAIFGDACPP